MTMDELKKQIRHVPDFPKPGILFYDVTTLLKSPDGFKSAVDYIVSPFQKDNIDLAVGIESRGSFRFGRGRPARPRDSRR